MDARDPRPERADPGLATLLGDLARALESLEATGARRLLARLEVHAAETEADGPGRAAFYAHACRAMFALVEGDLVGAATMTDEARRIGDAAELEESARVIRSLRSQRARQLGDREGMAVGAAASEDDGSVPALAEAAILWLESGRTAQASRLVDRLGDRVADRLGTIGDERERLVVAARLCEAAIGSGRRVAASACARVLEPYAGRALVAPDATTFAGVVDDYLALATGDRDRADRARTAYEDLGAWWWARRRGLHLKPSTSLPQVLHLHPSHRSAAGVQWCVGLDGHTRMVTAMPGLDYLRRLLQHPGQDLSAEDLGDDQSPQPRRRIVVRQAIAATLARLEMHDPDLARELRATIRTGLSCRYDPDPLRPTAWHLDVDVLHGAGAPPVG